MAATCPLNINMKKVVFADFDLDGDLDGVTKTDFDTNSDSPAMFLFINDGDGIHPRR